MFLSHSMSLCVRVCLNFYLDKRFDFFSSFMIYSSSIFANTCRLLNSQCQSCIILSVVHKMYALLSALATYFRFVLLRFNAFEIFLILKVCVRMSRSNDIDVIKRIPIQKYEK